MQKQSDTEPSCSTDLENISRSQNLVPERVGELPQVTQPPLPWRLRPSVYDAIPAAHYPPRISAIGSEVRNFYIGTANPREISDISHSQNLVPKKVGGLPQLTQQTLPWRRRPSVNDPTPTAHSPPRISAIGSELRNRYIGTVNPRKNPDSCKAAFTWNGRFPYRKYVAPIYSPKVFLGGIPWDITEASLRLTLQPYGLVRVEWPEEGTKAGYVYLLFESDKSIKSLLQSCMRDVSTNEWFFKMSSERLTSQEVQIIPWVITDSNYMRPRQPCVRLDANKTVFVGALHGMLTSEELAQVMNDLFGNVVYADIYTDKYKYPIGAGHVTFSSHYSYLKAVKAAFIEIKTRKFRKKVQIDPFIEDTAKCNLCQDRPGSYFCRELPDCLRYYCRQCWEWQHSSRGHFHDHRPLMKNQRRRFQAWR